mmetsp:Transcript_162627/g.521384  ORF Transcript_162627/g.521384 Transcript_162627/m.521384 type:complete len:265 (-) Transcript_162627:1199-1993(-)
MCLHQLLSAQRPGYCHFVKRYSSTSGSDTGRRPLGEAAPVRRRAMAGPTCSPGSKSNRAASAPWSHSVVTAPETEAKMTTLSAAPPGSARNLTTKSAASGRLRFFLSQPSSECAAAQNTATSAPSAAEASALKEISASMMKSCTPCSGLMDLVVITKPLPPPRYTLPCFKALSSVWLQYLPMSAIFRPEVVSGKVSSSFFSRIALSMMVFSATARCASVVAGMCPRHQTSLAGRDHRSGQKSTSRTTRVSPFCPRSPHRVCRSE